MFLRLYGIQSPIKGRNMAYFTHACSLIKQLGFQYSWKWAGYGYLFRYLIRCTIYLVGAGNRNSNHYKNILSSSSFLLSEKLPNLNCVLRKLMIRWKKDKRMKRTSLVVVAKKLMNHGQSFISYLSIPKKRKIHTIANNLSTPKMT